MFKQIAISLATADLEFAKQIGQMLDQFSYIDGCDTLGQRANKADIHKVVHFAIFHAPLIFHRHSYLCIKKSWNFTKPHMISSLKGEDD
jgi:hypothetical protein